MLTGGYIKNIAVRAAFFAAASSMPMSTALIHHAALLELEDMGHVVFLPPDGEDEAAADEPPESWFDYQEG